MTTLDKLYDSLTSYYEKDYYPMHMPGHKRNTKQMKMVNPYAIDITEIEGFDNLHQAEGVIKQLSDRISCLYGAQRSFPIINGSTAGILAGISATTNYGDKVLVARNCHKSVYHAISLRGLIPTYLYPPQVGDIPVNGGILATDMEAALMKHKDITLVIITSPTYEGIVSGIKEISEVVHRHGALLLVDEAHGAHFGFHEGFPKSALTMGADLVIQSLHKTLPAFTQTAVLHSNVSHLNQRIQQFLAIYQSSSPSYILMSGIDRCINMLEEQGEELFSSYYELIQGFYQDMKGLNNLKLLKRDLIGLYGIQDLDISKITISVQDTNLTGHQLHCMLYDKYHIVMEMETPNYVLGMTSICDTKEGMQRLSNALLEIDNKIIPATNKNRTNSYRSLQPVLAMLPAKALEQKTEQIKLENSCGRISSALICMYPPGSPILAPGEIIDTTIIQTILQIKQEGTSITGLGGEAKDEIEVTCD